MQIEENVPLAPLTTIGIGGPARYFTRAGTVEEVRSALAWARSRQREVFVLGGGSNLLISDDGFDGLVIRIDLRGITVESESESALVNAASGESWDHFVGFAVERGWAGIECLSGIPGSCGATPIQNVGAYGQEVSETIARVEALDRSSGLVRTFTNDECEFGYRSSRFKGAERARYVILAVVFQLTPGGRAAVRYPELLRYLKEQETPAQDLRGVREAVIAIRRRKAMVIDPADPDTRSDGSFFMNPVLGASEYEAFARLAPEAPHYRSGDGIKLSAAWLIENAGFARGFVHGAVGLSTKHALAIVNRGGGTAREVSELARMIRGRVRERFGVELIPEPDFVGTHPGG